MQDVESFIERAEQNVVLFFT